MPACAGVTVWDAHRRTVRRGMDASVVARISAMDLWYGVLAGLIVVVGFAAAMARGYGWFG